MIFRSSRQFVAFLVGFSIAVSVGTSFAPALPIYSGQFTSHGDYFSPQEDVRVAMTILGDAAGGRLLVTVENGDAKYSTLCRADLNFMYLSWPHRGEDICLPVPLQPGAKCGGFQLPRGLQFVGNTSYRGNPAHEYRAVMDSSFPPAQSKYAQNLKLSATVDASSGLPLLINNAGQDGIFAYEQYTIYEFIDGVTPPPQSFTVPEACMTPPPTNLQSLPPQVRHRQFLRSMLPFLNADTHIGSVNVEVAKNSLTRYIVRPGLVVPASVDNRNFTTPVRDQFSCGGCWAFSASAAAEVVWHKARGTRPTRYTDWLSPQSLIDCVPYLDGQYQCNHGCNGNGCLAQPGQFIVDHGISTEAEYGYRAAPGPHCKMSGSTTVFPLQKQLYISPGPDAETEMVAAVAEYGAVRVAINVLPSLEFYGTGIFDEPACVPFPQHAVVVVGYGSEDGTDYWLIKNSFSTAWGQAGYIRMARGKNMCGIGNYTMVYVPKANSTTRSIMV